jgi:hypothetical protein
MFYHLLSQYHPLNYFFPRKSFPKCTKLISTTIKTISTDNICIFEHIRLQFDFTQIFKLKGYEIEWDGLDDQIKCNEEVLKVSRDLMATVTKIS